MIDVLLRVGGTLVGLAMVFAFLRSALQVAVVNRRRGDWLARRVGWIAHTTLARPSLKERTFDRVQDVLAWVMPLYIVLLIVVWFVLAQLGFSLLIWSLQAEHNLLQAVIASGSALSTLGFLTPSDMAGQLLAIPEGAMGLGIVVFFFTFIPGYQSAIQLREVRVAWLYARVRLYTGKFGPIEWLLRVDSTAHTRGFWEDWEGWFRNLFETHSVAPILSFVPSVHRGQSWLAVAAAILDGSSLCLAILDTEELPSAEICHITGVTTLRLLAAELAGNLANDASSSRIVSIHRADFDMIYQRMVALGARVKKDREDCWLKFNELRSEYERFVSILADSLFVPSSLLMGPLNSSRRHEGAESQ